MSTLTTYYKGDMSFEAELGNHKITIDVPQTMGGKDRGPMPPQLFMASLSSCIGAFVAQYCERVGIDDAGMSISLSYDRETNPVKFVNLKASINLPNGDVGSRLKALHGVAEQCPVHKTIESMNGIEIEVLDKNSKS